MLSRSEVGNESELIALSGKDSSILSVSFREEKERKEQITSPYRTGMDRLQIGRTYYILLDPQDPSMKSKLKMVIRGGEKECQFY